jgi:hypothetical protein
VSDPDEQIRAPVAVPTCGYTADDGYELIFARDPADGRLCVRLWRLARDPACAATFAGRFRAAELRMLPIAQEPGRVVGRTFVVVASALLACNDARLATQIRAGVARADIALPPTFGHGVSPYLLACAGVVARLKQIRDSPVDIFSKSRDLHSILDLLSEDPDLCVPAQPPAQPQKPRKPRRTDIDDLDLDLDSP